MFINSTQQWDYEILEFWHLNFCLVLQYLSNSCMDFLWSIFM